METGFVVYPTYSIHGDKAYVYLFGRLKNGESFLSINEFRPYFMIRTKDVAKAKKIIEKTKLTGDAQIENTKYVDFKKEKMSKIVLTIPREVPTLRKELEAEKIEAYEADIRFPYRFMMDMGIQGTMSIDGKPEQSQRFFDEEFRVDRLYLNPKLGPSQEKIPDLKIISLDVETDQDAKKLYAISLYFVHGKKRSTKSYIVSSSKVKSAHDFKDEKSLLEELQKDILEFDPDLITGWNVIDFDFWYLQKKFTENHLAFRFGRTDDACRVSLKEHFFMDSKATVPGRVVLDGLQMVRNSFISLPDYKLDTAASEILGERKLITDITRKGAIIDDLYKNRKHELVKYNAKDAELVIGILEKKDIINLYTTKSRLTGMPLDRVQASVATLDSLYLREARKRGIVCNSSHYNEKERGLTGGYVMNPKTGIHDNVIVLDFKSLYPSIMITFNIDPLVMDKNGSIQAPNRARFRDEEAILPYLIERIWKERDEAKKRDDQIASYALKIILNSFYGVLGNPSCRFFSMELGNSISTFGQFIIKNTAKELEKKDLEVLYSDTDSVFVKTKEKTTEGAISAGSKIAKEMNEYYKDWVKKKYKRESRLELEFEKAYKKIIFPKIRGSEAGKGAKKRYAGLLIKDGKERMDFTGLEFVRRDWTELSKKFQLTLLDRIFHEKEVTRYVKDFVKDVKDKKYDDLMVYTKAIRKDLDSYTKTTPPHVKAARKMKKLESNIIKYVITTDGPEPIENRKHSIDYEHYIEKQIKPIADSVLVFFDTTFDELMKGSTQKSLFHF